MSLRHLFLPLALSLPATLPAATEMATLFPDSTVAFMQVKDVPSLRKLDQHPAVKVFDQQVIRKLIGKAFEEIEKGAGEELAKAKKELEAETGLTVEQLLGKFDGAASVGLFDVKLPAFDSSEEPTAEAAFVADFSGDDALVLKVIAAMDKTAEEGGKLHENMDERTVEHEGAKIHVLKEKDNEDGEEFAWAATDGKLIFATGEEQVKEVIDRAKKADGSGLAKLPIYRELADLSGNSDVLFAFPLQKLLGDVQEQLRKQAEEGNAGGLPVSPLQIWTALGADKVRGGVMGVSFANGIIDFSLGLTYDEKPGLLTLIEGAGPGKAPDFIPADAASASYGTFKWDSFYDNLKKVLGEASPLAIGGMDMGLAQVKQKTGVDIREDLIGNMGPGWWMTSEIDTAKMTASLEKLEAGTGTGMEGQATVIAIESKDAKALGLAVKSLINGLAAQEGLFEDREYQGFTIHNLKGTEEIMPIGWLITDDEIIFNLGETTPLEKILSRKRKGAGDHFFASPVVQKALDVIPGGPDVFATGYGDMGKSVGSVITMMTSAMSEDLGLDEADVKALQNLKIPLSATAKSSISGKAAVIREIIAPIAE